MFGYLLCMSVSPYGARRCRRRKIASTFQLRRALLPRRRYGQCDVLIERGKVRRPMVPAVEADPARSRKPRLVSGRACYDALDAHCGRADMFGERSVPPGRRDGTPNMSGHNTPFCACIEVSGLSRPGTRFHSPGRFERARSRRLPRRDRIPKSRGICTPIDATRSRETISARTDRRATVPHC